MTLVSQIISCAIYAKHSQEKLKIKNRRRYVQKQKLNSSKDELDLLGDPEVDNTFSGAHEDLKNAAEQLYSSPPLPQPLHFETLSLKTPQTALPTPGTVLQNRIQNKLKKSWILNYTFNSSNKLGSSMLRSSKQCSLLESK